MEEIQNNNTEEINLQNNNLNSWKCHGENQENMKESDLDFIGSFSVVGT